MLKLSIPGPSRDPTYYIVDGNTVLLVDNTLFKVCLIRGSGWIVALLYPSYLPCLARMA
ncbi:hypothetical protein DAEQUDRAFT_732843 [Daedalea quercina L-15889]|uniref:Uncharacterized protein n=1 Tax=Daedalea quercina L-15889 TaxID=1314783 RepID=A0A165LDT2_9APHY|nr:hypothetical protein DAEQUDRAFT_732843 [Daedalea quercina L-15889]